LLRVAAPVAFSERYIAPYLPDLLPRNMPKKGTAMKIGTIGAGFIARAVASVAIKHGHEVMVSNTRGPDTLFSLTSTIGCKAGSPQEAAAFGDIVLVAIPLKSIGKINHFSRAPRASISSHLARVPTGRASQPPPHARAGCS
jgi:pyrroline-5-carboxylate reductase